MSSSWPPQDLLSSSLYPNNLKWPLYLNYLLNLCNTYNSLIRLIRWILLKHSISKPVGHFNTSPVFPLLLLQDPLESILDNPSNTPFFTSLWITWHRSRPIIHLWSIKDQPQIKILFTQQPHNSLRGLRQCILSSFQRPQIRFLGRLLMLLQLRRKLLEFNLKSIHSLNLLLQHQPRRQVEEKLIPLKPYPAWLANLWQVQVLRQIPTCRYPIIRHDLLPWVWKFIMNIKDPSELKPKLVHRSRSSLRDLGNQAQASVCKIVTQEGT